jgi:hypothetical protein
LTLVAFQPRWMLVDRAVREALRPGQPGGVGATFLKRYAYGKRAEYALGRVGAVWRRQRLMDALDAFNERYAR